VNKDFVPEHHLNITLIRVESSYLAFAKLLEAYDEITSSKKGISSLSFISGTAKVGENIYVGEFAFIGENTTIGNNVKIYPQVFVGDNVVIGDSSILYPGVKIYKQTVIGNNCTFHSGVVIGADGFGFAPQNSENYRKIIQIGNVIIEDDVEIGSNSTVDRATLGSTIIRKGSKLDNLIQVGHNAEIGENAIIASQTGVSGSTKIGNNCMIGGQVGIAGHLRIADNVKIAAQSGIGTSIKEKGVTLMGSPAFEIKSYIKSFVHFKNFADFADRIKELEQTVSELKNQQKK
jgi:UDP-3-O-[3-hydroxymyristoyl] glucosamine N-acyltransferase